MSIYFYYDWGNMNRIFTLLETPPVSQRRENSSGDKK